MWQLNEFVIAELLSLALFWSKRCPISIGAFPWPRSFSLLRLTMFSFLRISAISISLRFVISKPIIDKLRCTIPPTPISSFQTSSSFLWFFEVVVCISGNALVWMYNTTVKIPVNFKRLRFRGDIECQIIKLCFDQIFLQIEAFISLKNTLCFGIVSNIEWTYHLI